jgi:hypothetical protein
MANNLFNQHRAPAVCPVFAVQGLVNRMESGIFLETNPKRNVRLAVRVHGTGRPVGVDLLILALPVAGWRHPNANWS